MVVAQLQAKYKEVSTKAKAWVSKQPPAIEVAVVTAVSAIQGGFIGGMMGTLTNDLSSSIPQPPGGQLSPEAASAMNQMKAIGASPLVQARNFAVMTGVNAGITAAMKRARGGVEDVQTSMGAAFGSGLAFSLVSGIGGPNPIGSALSTGVVFSLIQGGIFQATKQFTQPAPEDVLYSKTRGMLSNLGLHKYEKNFKKGLLNDEALPLLNDSALQEVRIPPGPRLLILDHIKRNNYSSN